MTTFLLTLFLSTGYASSVLGPNATDSVANTVALQALINQHTEIVIDGTFYLDYNTTTRDVKIGPHVTKIVGPGNLLCTLNEIGVGEPAAVFKVFSPSTTENHYELSVQGITISSTAPYAPGMPGFDAFQIVGDGDQRGVKSGVITLSGCDFSGFRKGVMLTTPYANGLRLDIKNSIIEGVDGINAFSSYGDNIAVHVIGSLIKTRPIIHDGGAAFYAHEFVSVLFLDSTLLNVGSIKPRRLFQHQSTEATNPNLADYLIIDNCVFNSSLCPAIYGSEGVPLQIRNSLINAEFGVLLAGNPLYMENCQIYSTKDGVSYYASSDSADYIVDIRDTYIQSQSTIGALVRGNASKWFFNGCTFDNCSISAITPSPYIKVEGSQFRKHLSGSSPLVQYFITSVGRVDGLNNTYVGKTFYNCTKRASGFEYAPADALWQPTTQQTKHLGALVVTP